ncbi:hypothetical protein FN846DRAFT_894780 [Sphaerosporella brunnea]|uniref:F-box domain-containing protein n=1 Tax=Sphaerosporella brunnea TaxID=1250544 RepID=A0A5J5EIL0_9PEZI|nr:hypothetical protein FN846DRAFT_894780 [Sphaerosporella brunnea]
MAAEFDLAEYFKDVLTPQPHTLLRLPVELLLHIARCLPAHDLYALACANRFLYRSLKYDLYDAVAQARAAVHAVINDDKRALDSQDKKLTRGCCRNLPAIAKHYASTDVMALLAVFGADARGRRRRRVRIARPNEPSALLVDPLYDAIEFLMLVFVLWMGSCDVGFAPQLVCASVTWVILGDIYSRS